jgi:serine/threonine protein kinase
VTPTFLQTAVDGFTQTNILIDSDFHPRLTDYGLITIISDPNTVDPGSTTSPSDGTVRYMAPELLNPTGFGLKNSNPTKKSDVYAFGVVTYQVSIAFCGSATVTNGST